MMRLLLRSPAGVLLPGLFAFLLASVSGCKRSAPAGEGEEKQVAPVKAVAARRVPLAEYTELLGGTQPLPQHAARVTAPVEGHVLWVLSDGSGPAVVEGQHVDKGQVIVQLDDRGVRATRDKTRAMLEELQQQKQQADIAMRLARLDRESLENLPGSAGGSIPLVSRLALNKAQLALEDAESKQKATLAKERALCADLQGLDVHLEYFKLRAPIAGRLGTVGAVPGQTLSVGTSVAEVFDLSEIDVVCTAPPAAAARLALGQPAWLAGEPAAGPRESGPAGKVVFIAVQAQAETGNFLVKVRFPNPDLRLRAGMVTRVQVCSRPEEQRLTVPKAALMEDQNDTFVVVAEEVKAEKNKEGEEETLGKARKLRALTGVRDRDRNLVEILGLEDPEKKEKVPLDGRLFLVEGGHGLHDGDVVKVERPKEKE